MLTRPLDVGAKKAGKKRVDGKYLVLEGTEVVELKVRGRPISELTLAEQREEQYQCLVRMGKMKDRLIYFSDLPVPAESAGDHAAVFSSRPQITAQAKFDDFDLRLQKVWGRATAEILDVSAEEVKTAFELAKVPSRLLFGSFSGGAKNPVQSVQQKAWQRDDADKSAFIDDFCAAVDGDVLREWIKIIPEDFRGQLETYGPVIMEQEEKSGGKQQKERTLNGELEQEGGKSEDKFEQESKPEDRPEDKPEDKQLLEGFHWKNIEDWTCAETHQALRELVKNNSQFDVIDVFPPDLLEAEEKIGNALRDAEQHAGKGLERPSFVPKLAVEQIIYRIYLEFLAREKRSFALLLEELVNAVSGGNICAFFNALDYTSRAMVGEHLDRMRRQKTRSL